MRVKIKFCEQKSKRTRKKNASAKFSYFHLKKNRCRQKHLSDRDLNLRSIGTLMFYPCS